MTRWWKALTTAVCWKKNASLVIPFSTYERGASFERTNERPHTSPLHMVTLSSQPTSSSSSFQVPRHNTRYFTFTLRHVTTRTASGKSGSKYRFRPEFKCYPHVSYTLAHTCTRARLTIKLSPFVRRFLICTTSNHQGRWHWTKCT